MIIAAINRTTRVVVEPLYEPVSLAEAKEWCRVENDLEDALLTMLIVAARTRAEELTGRAFVPRTVELAMDQFPQGDHLPVTMLHSPVISVESVTYTDSAGAEQSMDIADVLVDTKGLPGTVFPAAGASWPSSSGNPGSVVIRYRGGYVPTESPDDEAAYQAVVPALVKNWMHVRICTFYDHRESLSQGNIAEFPRDYVDGLLDGLVLNIGAA